MRNEIIGLWPELEWIISDELREKVLQCWIAAFESSTLIPEDLRNIPFSLLIGNHKVSFINHKRTCVQIAVDIAKRMQHNFGEDITINIDYLIAGAILIDVGKIAEYEITEDHLVTSQYGKLIRHPFSGLSLAERCGLPPEVLHIIATHSVEGNSGKRTIESIIVHHADFVSFDPFRDDMVLKI